MYGRANQIASYGRVANAEADPIQQVVMLYDGATKFLRLAASSIEDGELRAKAEQTDRALQIVNYLQSVLDFERGGEVAATLNTLYTEVTLLVLKASAGLDAAKMRRAADLLEPVRGAWAAIAADARAQESSAQAPSAPARQHAPLRSVSA